MSGYPRARYVCYYTNLQIYRMKLTTLLCAPFLLSHYLYVHVGCVSSKSGVVAPTSGIIRVYIRFTSRLFLMRVL